MTTRIQVRRGTASDWTSANPTLTAGEIGFETDTGKFKIGTGSTAWTSLVYASVRPGDLDELAQDAVNAAIVAGVGLDKTYDDNANTITLDIDSTVTTNSGTQTLSNKTLTSPIVDGLGIIFEGAVADSYETTLSVTEPTDDRTITIPDATGTVILDTTIAEHAQDAVGNAVGNGLDYDDNTGAISVDPSEFALNAVGAPTGNVSMATYKITNLGAPVSGTDAATKSYVDAVSEGLHIHASTQAATTANIDISGSYYLAPMADTIDGVEVFDGMRVLVKNQNTASQNGIYVLTFSGGTGTLSRALDFDSPAEIDGGDFIFVTGGTVNDNTGWVQTNTVGTIGTDPISFTQFSGAGTYQAGNGLTLTGNTFSINTATTVDVSTAQTLTNKTLTSPVISSITNTGTISLPTSTDTLIGRATTDTLTNKTISGANNTLTVRLANDVTGTLPVANGGTGVTTSTGSGSVVLSTSPTLTTPVIDSISASSSSATTSLFSNNTTGTIGLGTGAINGSAITIGSSSDVASATRTINIATGGGTSAATNINIGPNGTSGTGTLNLYTSSSQVNTKTINIGTGGLTGAVNITLGSSSGATSTINLNGTVNTSSGSLKVGNTTLAQGVTGTITFPATADTLVGRATTDTLTNKTISAGTLTGTLTAGGAVGTNGQFLQTTGTGVQWATVSSYTAPTIGSTSIASGATVTTIAGLTLTSPTISSITNTGTLTLPTSTDTLVGRATTDTLTNKTLGATSSSTLNANTTTAIDTIALSSFTSAKYVISLKQGSKVRTSEVIMQTDGTTVDTTEFGVLETGGTMSAVLVTGTVSGTNALLNLIVTDAASTNVTVRLYKVVM